MTVALADSMKEWKRIEDVDFWVQEAASLIATVPGANTKYVAAHMQKGEEQLKRALAHPVVKEHIARLEFEVIKARGAYVAGVTDTMTRVVEKSVQRIEECLPEASLKDAVAAARFACEVHPDSTFKKTERKEHNHTHQHYASGALLETLKQRNAAPIEIEAQVVDEEDDAAGDDDQPEAEE